MHDCVFTVAKAAVAGAIGEGVQRIMGTNLDVSIFNVGLEGVQYLEVCQCKQTHLFLNTLVPAANHLAVVALDDSPVLLNKHGIQRYL